MSDSGDRRTLQVLQPHNNLRPNCSLLVAHPPLLRSSNPICSIKDFYVPALNKTLNSTTTTSIYFDIELDNPNRDEGIYYNTQDLTFYYKHSNQTYSPVANQTFVGLYSTKGIKRRLAGAGRWKPLECRGGRFSGRFPTSMPVFRVGLVTSFRFKVLSRKTKKHELAVGADVAVNDSGVHRR